MDTKQWTVEISLSEDAGGHETHAEARLHTDGGTRLLGQGRARRNPLDRGMPEIGAKLATARALSDLAHELLHAAAEDIHQVSHS